MSTQSVTLYVPVKIHEVLMEISETAVETTLETLGFNFLMNITLLGGETIEELEDATGFAVLFLQFCRGITRIHQSPSRPRPAVRPTAILINIHEHLI